MLGHTKGKQGGAVKSKGGNWTGMSRRGLLAGAGAAAVPLLLPGTGALAAEQSPLPVATPGLDHLDIMVADPEAAARFYMQLFATRLHAQPFQGAFRYFVLLGELPESREVSYLAIGTSRREGAPYIGHFCTTVFDYRRDSEAIAAALDEALRAAGLGRFPGFAGIGGIFQDPDGIEIQFLPAPDTLVTAAEPSDLVPPGQGLLRPLGVDHVLLRVSDLPRARDYYRLLYGPEAGHQHAPERLWFDFSASRLLLEEAPYGYGEEPGIARFCIKVAPFDPAATRAALSELGAEPLAAPDEPGVLRFRDPFGIEVEVKATEATERS